MTKKIKEFRKKLKNGHVTGPFSKTCDPAFIEIMGYAGFDFVILDLEHGPNSVQTLENLIRAALVADILPIVRVKENTPHIIGEVLDIGAAGIQVPQITSGSEAKDAICRAKFAPHGERGICRFVRAADYSTKDRFEYFKEANEAIIILQLEGKQAILNVDEILEVDGYDVIFIGPYDLSQSLGYPGEIKHSVVINAIQDIREKCCRRNIAVGIFADTVADALFWKQQGISYLSYSVDVGLFAEHCKAVLQELN